MNLVCEWCGGHFERSKQQRFCQLSCATAQRQVLRAEHREQEAIRLAQITEATCRGCGETKPVEAFTRASGNANGRSTHCKDCVRRERGHVQRGTYGRCGVPTALGHGPCRNEAGPEGICSIHAGRGNRWKRTHLDRQQLVDEVAALAKEGFGQGAIAHALGVGGMLVWSCLVDAGMSSNYAGDSSLAAKERAKGLVDSWRYASERERALWRKEAQKLVRAGRLSCRVPKSNAPSPELQELMDQQSIDAKRWTVYRPPNWIGLDVPSDDRGDNYDLIWDVDLNAYEDETPDAGLAHMVANNGADMAAIRAKRHLRMRWPDRVVA